MPVRVADDVVIGAGSVVTGDITAAGTYAGQSGALARIAGRITGTIDAGALRRSAASVPDHQERDR